MKTREDGKILYLIISRISKLRMRRRIRLKQIAYRGVVGNRGGGYGPPGLQLTVNVEQILRDNIRKIEDNKSVIFISLKAIKAFKEKV